MDRYHVYEELGAGTHSQVFKGRRKKSIEYVAIKRVDKRKIDNVIQEINVIHHVNSPNVVKLYDLHETGSSVCLILELCAGGDLRTLIKQDLHEPESAVQRFGLDILAGLQHTHASGFLHGNLRPSNILIDEYGTLKLGGYGFSRSVADVDAAGTEGGKAKFEWQTREHQNHKQCGEFGRAETTAIRDPTYMAPELLSGGEDALSFASDFWSLGCVLFELLTGEPPFRPSQYVSVEERIMREDPPGLKQWGWKGVRMSLQFRSLVRWLLQKDPLRRPTWPQLLAHPFWDNCQTQMPAQPRLDQAVLAARAAAEDTARQASPRGIGSNSPRPLVKPKHEEMEHTADSEGQWRLSDVRRGENSPTGGERRARQASQAGTRERANRQMSRRDRGGMGRVAAGGMHAIEENDSPQRGLKEWRRAASTAGDLSPVGTIRGIARETRAVVDRSAAVSPISSFLGSGQGANVQQYESARYPLSNDARAWCNGDMERGGSASYGPSLDSGMEGDSFVRSLTSPSLPPSVPVAAVFELGGVSDEVESGSIGERIAMGSDGGGTGGCIDVDVVSRAAPVRGLRLCRGTPPGNRGWISPSVLSVASAGWSVGDHYRDEFEEEAESSRFAGYYSPSLSSSPSSGFARSGSKSLSAAESRSRLHFPSSSSGSGEGSPGNRGWISPSVLSAASAGWSVGDHYRDEFEEEAESSRFAGYYSPSLSSSPSSGFARSGSKSLSAAESRSRLHFPSSSSGSGEGSPGNRGWISPSVLSAASAGWSVGDHYRDEFKEETESSMFAGYYSPSLSSSPSSGFARYESTSLSAAESRSRLHFPSSSSGSGEGSSEVPQGVLATALSVDNFARVVRLI